MKLQVIKSFNDKKTKVLHEVGTEIELTDAARINDVVVRGLCLITEIESQKSETTQEEKSVSRKSK